MLAVAATRPLRPRPQLSITNSGPWAYAYSAAFIHPESIPEIGSVVESSAVDIEGGEGKSVCMASVFSEGQHIYSTSVLS
jgi:hypothetical protein